MVKPSGVLGDAASAARSLAEAAANWWSPRLRLGVTGLSRSGKTIFITALVNALVAGGRLPMFAAQSQGRIRRAGLTLQPDDTVARFAYEENLAAMRGPARHWPESTRRISELSIEIEYESNTAWFGGAHRLTLDFVDYPGEWLLDLPLIEQSYPEFCRASLAAAREPARETLSAEWRAFLAALDPQGAALETEAIAAADVFRRYLVAARAEPHTLSLLPPGRFLMPGVLLVAIHDLLLAGDFFLLLLYLGGDGGDGQFQCFDFLFSVGDLGLELGILAFMLAICVATSSGVRGNPS